MAGTTLPLRESQDIQGNVLAPFNKPYQRFLFISFMNRPEQARTWLGQLLVVDGNGDGGVATTKQVFDHNEEYKHATRDERKGLARWWVGVGFTSSGLVTLDRNLARDLVAYEAFWQGPLVDRPYRGQRAMSPAVLGDVDRGDPMRWVVGGPGQYPVDAVVTVAADNEDRLKEGVNTVLAAAVDPDPAVKGVPRVAVLSWQDCQRRPTDQVEPGVEPFGFRDGISQPGVRGFTAPTVNKRGLEATDQPGSPIIAAGEFVLGCDGETGSYPAGRPVPPGWMHDGSFQVVLRLRQDVDGWTAQMRELKASSGDTFEAAAMAIGRTTAGEPLAAPGRGDDFNDFDFRTDQLGDRTPRFAHIRKMNPRNGTPDERIHRVLRRGIPFARPLQVGKRLPGAEEVAENAAGPVERGLVFNAFMASIESQFEYLQRNWANNPDSLPPVGADGPDPLIGASAAPCVVRRGKADPVEIHFGRFVWTSGAVYAFAPSLTQLGRLAAVKDEVKDEVTDEVTDEVVTRRP